MTVTYKVLNEVDVKYFRKLLVEIELLHYKTFEINSMSSEDSDQTIYVATTKALTSCLVTTQLICAFVFAYAKSNLLSRDMAHTKDKRTNLLPYRVVLSLS